MANIHGSQDNSAISSKYEVPDIVLFDPKNRKLKILTIGAGVSGIMMAYKIQKECENVEHIIYEKNEDIGGTWLENRYPGCACDVPSHAYTYNFALNPDWSRYSSRSEEIWRYLNKVCEVFDLRKYTNFNTEVVGCYWNEDDGQWTVKLRKKEPVSEKYTEFEEKCDILLHGTGILNNFKWPDIEGLDLFKGKVIHTARWPKEYQEAQWKSESVAIIGSGASSIQTLPTMQPHGKHIDTFVRTPIWFVSIAGNDGNGVKYTEDEKREFRNNIPAMVKYAKHLETMVNSDWSLFMKNSPVQLEAQELFRTRMAEFIKDERLLKGFTPKFGIGCRRITPGDPYMRAIQEPNVDVHFTHVVKITEDSVIDSDGNSFKPDTIVCATGFDVSYRPRFPIVGRNGVDLREKWKTSPESYLGLSVPDIPNFITFIGPTWPVENGSVIGPLGQVANYAVKMIKKMQAEFIDSFEPKQDVTDAFNEHTQELLKQTVWTDDCRAWYRNNETGRVNAVYPGSSLHYYKLVENPRYEDYNFKYQNKKNMWAFLGRGFTVENFMEDADHCPWLSEEFIDPKWLPVIKSGISC
ncbi:flavin-binding monooxygenase-like protein [Xylogone sp. PMI_703]|nr:flavin-binding monooxygenase-like protein [Xylogone sp. PMI_703]